MGTGTESVPLLPRRPQEHGLSDQQRDEFEDMLRGLTLEREQVKKAMAFALDNAEAANDVR